MTWPFKQNTFNIDMHQPGARHDGGGYKKKKRVAGEASFCLALPPPHLYTKECPVFVTFLFSYPCAFAPEAALSARKSL